jgi:uroporphyrinogen III methyltransferase/synthase
VLVEKLVAGGAAVTVVPVYRNVRPAGYEVVRESLEKRTIDVVTFTSSSTVTNFLEMLEIKDRAEFERLLGGVKVAVIGPVTAKTARKRGLEVDIQPQTYTIPALVEEIVGYFAKDGGLPGETFALEQEKRHD